MSSAAVRTGSAAVGHWSLFPKHWFVKNTVLVVMRYSQGVHLNLLVLMEGQVKRVDNVDLGCFQGCNRYVHLARPHDSKAWSHGSVSEYIFHNLELPVIGR